MTSFSQFYAAIWRDSRPHQQTNKQKKPNQYLFTEGTDSSVFFYGLGLTYLRCMWLVFFRGLASHLFWSAEQQLSGVMMKWLSLRGKLLFSIYLRNQVLFSAFLQLYLTVSHFLTPLNLFNIYKTLSIFIATKHYFMKFECLPWSRRRW